MSRSALSSLRRFIKSIGYIHSTYDVGRSMFILSFFFDQTGRFGGQRLG